MANRVRFVEPSSPRASNLTESQAMSIALAWRKELQGCVMLVTDEEPVPTSIISTFAWVRFRFDGASRSSECLESTAAYARAATIAWFALSCCEGYSGAENPSFWRQVFLKLLLLPSTRDCFKASDKLDQFEEPAINDPVRFFGNVDKPFPRVMLRTRGAPGRCFTANEIFLGRTPFTDNARDAILRKNLAVLRPFMRADHMKRSVPVSIDEVSCDMVPASLREPRLAGGPDPPDVLLAFTQMNLVSFRVCEDRVVHLHPPRVSQSPLNATEGCSKCSIQPHQLQQHGWRIRRREVGSAYCQDLCVLGSDLSWLRSSRHLDLDAVMAHDHERSDWAWLGFAIFHPDAAEQSDLTSLDINMKKVNEDYLVCFANMALGNNLLTAQDPTTSSPSSAYIEGRVKASTRIWSWSSEREFKMQGVVDEDMWITLCVSSPDTVKSQEWISIVNPDSGLGWIHHQSITTTRSRPPTASSIQALRVTIGAEDKLDEKVVAHMLVPFGKNLSALHIVGGAPVSSKALHEILRLCPALKTLCVRHDGSLWANEKDAMVMPRIEELELHIDGSSSQSPALQTLVATCLPHLQALRIVSSSPGSFEENQDALYTFLSRQQTLTYLRWSERSKSSESQRSEPWYHQILRPRAFHVQHEERVIDIPSNVSRLQLRLDFQAMCHPRNSTMASVPLDDVSDTSITSPRGDLTQHTQLVVRRFDRYSRVARQRSPLRVDVE